MRTETITRTVYTFEELSEEAQQRAIRDRRGEGVPTDHIWDEARQSVNAFCDTFNVSTGSRSWLDIICPSFGSDSERNELSGQRLRTYLINNFPSAFYERKHRNSYYSEERPAVHRMRTARAYPIDRNGKQRPGYWVTLRSNFETESSCPFTGVCYDEDLLHPLKEFIKQPDGRTFEDLMSEAGESLRNSLENEEDYLNSDEAISEALQDAEFTEDGERA